jgi:zinc/manganese transport system ATP-binding protein
VATTGDAVTAAISLKDASVRRAGRTIWSHVTMKMGRGEFVALLGANGSGKSTLLSVILGELPASGEVSVLGRRPGAANARIGYLPQRRVFDAGTRLRGRDIVRLGFDGDRWGLPLPAAHRLARSARGGIALAAAIAVASMWAGLGLAYAIPSLPPSTAVVGVAVVVYAASAVRG